MGRASNGNYIKLYRKLLENTDLWGKPDEVMIFIYCLLKAEWQDTINEDGKFIPRGSFIITLKEFAEANKMTVRHLRYTLLSLTLSRNLSHKRVGKRLMVTVVKYNEYQNRVTKSVTKSVTKNDSFLLNKKEKEREENSPPSLDEVTQFALEINSKTNPEKFFWYYQANGWPLDWKSKFHEWTTQDGKYEVKDEDDDIWES